MATVFIGFNIADSSVSDFFLALANRLAEDDEVVIFSATYRKEISGIHPNIKIHIWPSKRPTGIKDFFFLQRHIKNYRPKVMIAVFGAVNMFLFTGYLMGVKHRIVWRRTLSSQFTTKKVLRIRKGLFYRLASQVVANSKATKEDLVDNFFVKESKVKVVCNAVKKYEERGSNVQQTKIVYVGRMHPSKGVEVLLDAMPAIIKMFPEVRLHLIGGNLEGKEVVGYMKRAQDMNLLKNIKFFGSLSKEEVLKMLSTACVTIIPSFVEAFGFVIIESFSVKTPVVASRTTGIMEIVRDGVDGLLCEPGNVKEFSEKTIEVLSNPDFRANLSQNCYKRFLENFELDLVVNGLYQKINGLN